MKNNNYNPTADQYFIEKYFEATEAIREAVRTPFAVVKSNGTIVPCDTVEEVENIRSEDSSAFPCKISSRLAPADNSRLREEAEAEAAADGVCNEPAEKQEQEQEAPAEAQEPAEAMERISQIRTAVSASTGRSAWSRGVNDYALELLGELEEAVRGGWQDMDAFSNKTMLRKALLNGADSWSQYSWGGSSLIYDCNIAERLCCPSELKKTRNGERRPNAREEWLDTQARALGQACYRIVEANRKIAYMEEASNE